MSSQDKPSTWTRLVLWLRYLWCEIWLHNYHRVEGTGERPGEETHWVCPNCRNHRVGRYLKGECHVSKTVTVEECPNEQ